MAFNDMRKRVALTVRDKLGEPASYQRAAGGAAFGTIVIVHRARSLSDANQRLDKRLSQSVNTVTLFTVGDEYDVTTPKNDDTVTLTASGEVFKLSGAARQRDEYKITIPAQGPIPP